jgi:SAM-dependent methyltransferase
MNAGVEFKPSSFDAMVRSASASGFLIAGSLAALGPRVLLDAGCGPGVVANAAWQLDVPRVVGCDIHTWAREYLLPGVEFVRCDLSAGPTPALPESDVVACFEVLEHIEPQRSGAACAALAAAVAPGGVLAFGAARPGQPGCGHVCCKPREHWLDVFRKLGLAHEKGLEAAWASGWRDAGVLYYYWQNLCVFRRSA